MRFKDRVDASKQLAAKLKPYQSQNVVVLALPRGGVVLGAEVAKVLKAPLDLVIPRKIGHPFNSEYAIAAVTENGEVVQSEQHTDIGPTWFEREVKGQIAEAKRRRLAYLGGRKLIDLKGKVAIVIDDGVATGLTMLAAINDVRKRRPQKVVVAVPVSPPDFVGRLRQEGVELVALLVDSDYMGAVAAYYGEFGQVSDKEVTELLKSNRGK